MVTKFTKIIGTRAVIKFDILDAVPQVKLSDILWKFTNRSGEAATIQPSNELGVSFSADLLTLTILSTQLINDGTYTVDVSNAAGRASGSVQLDILGR